MAGARMDLHRILYISLTCIVCHVLLVHVCHSRTIETRWIQRRTTSCSWTAGGLTVKTNSLFICLAYVRLHTNFATSALVSFDNATGLCTLHTKATPPTDDLATYTPEKAVAGTKAWTKKYAIDSDGNVVFGNVPSLMASTDDGADIRIQLGVDFFYDVNNAFYKIKNTHICVMTPFIIAKTSWDTFNPIGLWNLTLVCTTGNLHIIQQNIGAPGKYSDNIITSDATWYTRYLGDTLHAYVPPLDGVLHTTCTSLRSRSLFKVKGQIMLIPCSSLNFLITPDTFMKDEQDPHRNIGDEDKNPIYRHDGSGLQTCGDVLELFNAVRNGNSAKVKLATAVLPTHRLQFDQSIQITGQLNWNIALSGIVFNREPYWLFYLMSTNGIFSVTRYYMGEHRLIRTSSNSIGYSWYVDMHWSLVHNSSFHTTDNIRSRIITGHRIRIVYDKYALEADNVVIATSGLITAQLLNNMDTSSQTQFTGGWWRWVIIKSDGTVQTHVQEVGSTTKISESIQTGITSSWFAETRHWTLAVSLSTGVLSGSLAQLKEAIRAGSTVRCVITYPSGEILAVTADNVEISSTGQVAAVVFRYINFEATPYWRILLISTHGTVTEFKWRVGEHVYLGTSVSQAKIDWFVDL